MRVHHVYVCVSAAESCQVSCWRELNESGVGCAHSMLAAQAALMFGAQ